MAPYPNSASAWRMWGLLILVCLSHIAIAVAPAEASAASASSLTTLTGTNTVSSTLGSSSISATVSVSSSITTPSESSRPLSEIPASSAIKSTGGAEPTVVAAVAGQLLPLVAGVAALL